MKNLNKVVTYIVANRRLIGSIVGSLCMLFGYSDEASMFYKVGELP